MMETAASPRRPLKPWPDSQVLRIIRPWSEPRMSEAWSRRLEIKGVVQRSGGRRNWSELGKDGLVAFAKREIAANGISSRRELQEKDSGLYQALVRRKLVDVAFSGVGRREHRDSVDGVLDALDSFWEHMPPAGRMPEKNGCRETAGSPDDQVAKGERRRLGLLSGMNGIELAGYAEWLIAALGIETRNELACKDAGLYSTLKAKGLLGAIGLPDSLRRWAEMPDDELVSFTKRVIEEKAIGGKAELEKVDSKLHGALKRRGLLDRLGFARKGPDWRKMGRDEIAEFARRLVKENNISGRWELEVRFKNVYAALKRRGMMDEVGLGEKSRNWGRMGDYELAEFAKMFVEECGISGKEAFRKADRGLYGALKRRGLVGRLGFKETHRTWKGMDREELLARAREIIAVQGIRTRKMLQKRDSGLYNTLSRRGLLDWVGFEERRREWGTDREVLAYAGQVIAEKGIRNRHGLEKADRRLYEVLRGRGLLDAAFARIESSKHDDAVDGVLDALESFGDAK